MSGSPLAQDVMNQMVQQMIAQGATANVPSFSGKQSAPIEPVKEYSKAPPDTSLDPLLAMQAYKPETLKIAPAYTVSPDSPAASIPTQTAGAK